MDIGEGYKNDLACSTFVDYIARDMRSTLSQTLKKKQFFNIQKDGSTDIANIEEEMLMVLYIDPNCNDGAVHLKSHFFCIKQPSQGNAEGLYDCFVKAMSYMGVADELHKLVGFGCDGTNVNMGEGGLKRMLQIDQPWVVVCWCLAHCLELALKDGFAWYAL